MTVDAPKHIEGALERATARPGKGDLRQQQLLIAHLLQPRRDPSLNVVDIVEDRALSRQVARRSAFPIGSEAAAPPKPSALPLQ